LNEHRNSLGVEPVCKVLPIAQSTFYAHAAIARDPELASERAKRDAVFCPEIKHVWEANNEVYGIRKVWHQLQREGFSIARCTVARLMKRLDIHGVIRGKAQTTTVQDKSQPCPEDKVNRKFRAPAPNMLWVSDSPMFRPLPGRRCLHRREGWQGFVYVAFVIDTFADKIVGWRVSSSPKTDFVLDALEQALHDRRAVHKGGLIHHSDRGGQYLSIRYSERLALAGIEPSVGSVGDSYDNALAETINGLYKAEVIHRLGPWKTMAAVEWETLKWVDWFNNRRLLEPIGYIPPAEAEERCYAKLNTLDMVA